MFGWSKKKQCPAMTDRELLYALLLEMKKMALDVTALNAAVAATATAVARNTAAVDALLAAHADPTGQAAVDAASAALATSNTALDAESAKAEAAVAPPVV